MERREDAELAQEELAQEHEEQRQGKKGYDRQGIYKSINSSLKAAINCVKRFPQVHGLLLLGGQVSGKWHLLHLGAPWRFVPRHIAVYVVQLVKDVLSGAHTLGKTVDNLAGKIAWKHEL